MKMLFQSVVRKKKLGGGAASYSLQSLLECYLCSRLDEYVSYGNQGQPVPPFGCTFCSASALHHVLAVANEEGIVRLYNTLSGANSNPVLREWMAHSNAVFDIAWVPGEEKMVTASGDQTAKLWDVKAGEVLGTFKGHQCSLKSVAFTKYEKAVFCTGARDGNIMVWDTRCSKKDGFYRQVKQISGAHNTLDKQTPSKQKKRKQPSRGLAPSVDFQQSVTVVLFQDEHTLISAGAVDGVIKVWDLRKTYAAYHQDPVASQLFPYAGTSTRKLGYSSLVLDSTGSRLFANCTDDSIYMFNMTGLKMSPVATFSGHQNSTFYVKSSVSPDDQFLISGSSDSNAYIWKVADPWLPPTMLQGHCQEVTSVDWCHSDFTKIATCSDDSAIRIWRLNRGTEEEKSIVGRADLVGWACRKKLVETKGAGKRMSPARIPRIEGTSALSSPRPAACAPNRTSELPLPTSTLTSSLETPISEKLTPQARQAGMGSTPSIKNWVTRTPSSSPSAPAAKTPSPRKALLPVVQSPAQATAAIQGLEKRAKRRLGSLIRESTKEWECLESCRCISELEPPSKKSKLDLCCLESETEKRSGLQSTECCDGSERAEGSSQSAGDCSLPASPLPATGFKAPSPSFKLHCREPRTEAQDKENSSPGRTNWLAALGESKKCDARAAVSKSCSTSPSTARGPGTKRQESRSRATSPQLQKERHSLALTLAPFLSCILSHVTTPEPVVVSMASFCYFIGVEAGAAFQAPPVCCVDGWGLESMISLENL
ncbi:denticleless protein homolog [Latimeria chalumnae]|uniref:denticleless protein homolog n=1 Tax=Latimeria chalumnae TaxID=7897 RepID=UPI00313B596D